MPAVPAARKQDNVASDMPSLDSPDLNTRDKDELLVIAKALGIAADGRASKATLISRILESTGGTPSAPATPADCPRPSVARDHSIPPRCARRSS